MKFDRVENFSIAMKRVLALCTLATLVSPILMDDDDQDSCCNCFYTEEVTAARQLEKVSSFPYVKNDKSCVDKPSTIQYRVTDEKKYAQVKGTLKSGKIFVIRTLFHGPKNVVCQSDTEPLLSFLLGSTSEGRAFYSQLKKDTRICYCPTHLCNKNIKDPDQTPVSKRESNSGTLTAFPILIFFHISSILS